MTIPTNTSPADDYAIVCKFGLHPHAGRTPDIAQQCLATLGMPAPNLRSRDPSRLDQCLIIGRVPLDFAMDLYEMFSLQTICNVVDSASNIVTSFTRGTTTNLIRTRTRQWGNYTDDVTLSPA